MKPSSQWLRHLIQVTVLLFLVVSPLLAWYRADVYAELAHRPRGPQVAGLRAGIRHTLDRIFVPAAAEAAATTPDKLVESRLSAVRGSTWSAEVCGLSLTDPLAGAEALVSGHATWRTVLIGIWIPVLITVLCGRIFCTWVCPVGFLLETADKLRSIFRRLGLRQHNLPLWRGQKHVVLVAGLVLSVLFAVPLLGYIYPPAVLVREVDAVISGWLHQRGPNLITIASALLFALVVVELVFSPRLWCRSLCPGGALYSLLGSRRLLRVRRNALNCTLCGNCVPVCGMGLNPMLDRTGAECDNCLACISSCDDQALDLKLALRDSRPQLEQPMEPR